VIVICYDGSADSQAAIARAGELFPGEHATVLSVWEPFVNVMARTGVGAAYSVMANVEEIDNAGEQAARERADEGVLHAGAAGLDAQALVCASTATVAASIVAVADEVDARAIVLGTRGLTGLKSAVLGSVSHAVLSHSDRPVLVVPSPQVAAERAANRRAR
jgi:nucleotide-binding universal stress UspA family protein